MNRKFIDISSQHKMKSGEIRQWVKSIPAHNFKFITANGVTFAILERTYYLDQKTDKIRYYNHDCSNASYDHLYTLFVEVYPGLFSYAGITSEDGLTERFERVSGSVKALQESTINEFRKSLVRYGV